MDDLAKIMGQKLGERPVLLNPLPKEKNRHRTFSKGDGLIGQKPTTPVTGQRFLPLGHITRISQKKER
jgi:hypothetical protein